MSASALRPRKLVALIGALLMLAGVGVVVGKTQPTEASWADQVRGKSTFGTNSDLGRNYARALTGNGIINRQVTSDTIGPARAFSTPRTGGTESRLAYDDSGWISALPMEVIGTSCASASSQLPQCATGRGLTTGSSFASSEVSALTLWLSGLKNTVNVTYGNSSTQAPVSATATCTPGKEPKAEATAGGPVLLKGRTPLYLPEPNRQTSASTWSISGITTGILQYRQEIEPGRAKAEVRLYVTSNEFLASYTTHIVLASAECGIGRDTPAEPARPTTARPENLPESANRPTVTPVTSRAAQRMTAETPESADTTTPAETTAPIETTAPAETTEPVETTAVAEPTPTEDATPESGEPTQPTEPGEATEQTTAAEGPQEPESVRVGREFAVVNRDGITLGTAKVEDIVRTPGCGVELTLSITTSAEAGTDRWASVAPDDFAEVRAGGSTREASRLSPDCEQAARSATTSLSPGRDHEIVIAFQLDDSADRAMLRPDGTAGWIFDLPPLPRVTATSPTAATTAEQAPATSTDTEATTTVVTTEA